MKKILEKWADRSEPFIVCNNLSLNLNLTHPYSVAVIYSITLYLRHLL